MTYVLKFLVIVVAFIAKAKRGFAEGSEGTANGFKMFWECNRAALVYSTTNPTFNKCNWYRRVSYNATSVTLQSWTYLAYKDDGTAWKAENWKFGENNSMVFSDVYGTTVKYLLNQTANGSCGVVKHDYFMYADEDLKNETELQCTKERDTERCREGPCTRAPSPTDLEEYVCRDRTYYELLVSEQRKDNVPDECMEFYNKTIGHNAVSQNKKEELKDCKYKAAIQ